jgi:competence protein ComFB
MIIKNFMEDLVWSQLDRVLARQRNICTCERCRYDIAALALNFLPPRYVVSDMGETYTKVKSLEQQFTIDIITAITNAAIIVNKVPHHSGEKQDDC